MFLFRYLYYFPACNSSSVVLYCLRFENVLLISVMKIQILYGFRSASLIPNKIFITVNGVIYETEQR